MRPTIVIAGLAAVILVPSAAVAGAADGRPSQPVTLSATPSQQEVMAGRPCLPAPPLAIGMTNTSDEPVYADTFMATEGPIRLSRGMFSSYLPPHTEVTAPVSVTAPYGSTPGTYDVTLESGRQTLNVPIQVTAPPAKAPGDNLLVGEQATPSSTYVTSSTEFDPCGAVDGDRRWTAPTGWQSAGRGLFPDTYTVTLPEPAMVNRIDLYTSNSTAAPPHTHGLRDWDVQVETGGDGQWRTVAQVRGNIEWQVTSTFEAVGATALRIVALASNQGDYARIAELEAFYDQPVN